MVGAEPLCQSDIHKAPTHSSSAAPNKSSEGRNNSVARFHGLTLFEAIYIDKPPSSSFWENITRKDRAKQVYRVLRKSLYILLLRNTFKTNKMNREVFIAVFNKNRTTCSSTGNSLTFCFYKINGWRWWKVC